MSLIAELKRRNVFRVIAAYAVLSWLLLQIADVVFEFMAIPDSAGRILIAFLAIGFLPVVLFSWGYELTPDGVKKESEVPPEDSVAVHTAKKLDVAVIIMLAVAITLFVMDRFAGAGGSPPEPEPAAQVVAGADSVSTPLPAPSPATT